MKVKSQTLEVIGMAVLFISLFAWLIVAVTIEFNQSMKTTLPSDKLCLDEGYDYASQTDMQDGYFRCIGIVYEDHMAIENKFSRAYSYEELGFDDEE